MNETVNKVLLAGDKIRPEMHLRQPGYTYSACGPFTKNKERILKFKERGDSRYIYQNELDKAYFHHDINYGDFKDLNSRTFTNKVLRNKAFNIAKNPKYDGHQRGLTSMVYKFFDKKTSGSGIKNENIPNKKLAEELHKTIIRTVNKRNVDSPFIDNVWEADLADMQLISKFNQEFRYLLYVMNIYTTYEWVIPLKDKKGITVTNTFQKILKDSNRKPNKTRVDKDSEFYNNKLMKSWLEENGIKSYSTHNERKPVVAERFIRNSKNKTYIYMTSVSKHVCIDKLDDIINKYNNAYHSTNKMKPVDVKSNTYIDSSKEVHDKNPNFKICDNVRISKYKNFFAKRYAPSWSEEVFAIKKVKNTIPWTYVISDLKGEGIVGTLYERIAKKKKKKNQKSNREKRRKVIY